MIGHQHPALATDRASDRTSPAGRTAKELSCLGDLLRDEKLDKFHLLR